MKDTKLYFGFSGNKEYIIDSSELKTYQNITLFSDSYILPNKFLKQFFKDVKNAKEIEVDYSITNANFDKKIKQLTIEMENRYVLFSENKVRNIYEFNEKQRKNVYKLKIFVIKDINFTITEKNREIFLRLLNRSGAAGFRFILICSNYKNELANSIYNTLPTKILFDIENIDAILPNHREVKKLKDNEYIFYTCFIDDIFLLRFDKSN